MQKASSIIFSLNKAEKAPIFTQLCDSIRLKIMSGELKEGDALPATRVLALEMAISRSSVVNAYEQLVAEGYISSLQGSGYKVMGMGELELARAAGPAAKSAEEVQHVPSVARPFYIDTVDAELFPSKSWAKTVTRICRQAPEEFMFGENIQGNLLLREAISRHVLEWRGLECSPQQIIITAGSADAIELCFETLSKPGDIINIEDPCYYPIRGRLLARQRQINLLDVDEQGAKADDIDPAGKLALITPSYQYPLGITMSLSRRMEFMQWAQQQNGWIIEDDYDGEFRYSGRPIPALASFDRTNHTIYIGSFSKLMSSNLRVSYLVLPEQLKEKFSRNGLRSKASLLPQRVLAEFIRNGEFYRYLRKARRIYGARRAFLLDLIAGELGEFGWCEDHKAGTMVVFHMKKSIPDKVIAKKGLAVGLRFRSLSSCCQRNTVLNGLIMGFTAYPETELKKGILRLKNILQEETVSTGTLPSGQSK